MPEGYEGPQSQEKESSLAPEPILEKLRTALSPEEYGEWEALTRKEQEGRLFNALSEDPNTREQFWQRVRELEGMTPEERVAARHAREEEHTRLKELENRAGLGKSLYDLKK